MCSILFEHVSFVTGYASKALEEPVNGLDHTNVVAGYFITPANNIAALFGAGMGKQPFLESRLVTSALSVWKLSSTCQQGSTFACCFLRHDTLVDTLGVGSSTGLAKLLKCQIT